MGHSLKSIGLERSMSSLSTNHFIDTTQSGMFHLSNEKMHRLDQQRYMGRKDGNKSFFKTRTPTRKQNKKYHKRMRDVHHEQVGRHSKPGSKAGPRREFMDNEHKFLVGRALGEIPDEPSADELEYDFGDAMVDDLIGNSAFLSASPNPKPMYLGRQYDKHFSKVSAMMKEYHAHIQLAKDSDQTQDNALAPPLPTDQEISLLVRSYKDRNSTKYRPLGIVQALKHLITEIRLPTNIFGEKTYAALMLCSASPKEARRIMKLMEDNGQPLDAYIYSILIDIHAKNGDYRGADKILSEMRFEGFEPTLPAYTSLLASCYKIINAASMPQHIKSEAGNLAWDRWKELKINDLEPDVMAYGAIIRIMAARGFPEKAINLIEEMQMREIRPTTLIFSGALKAVSRSHANALRFEGGRSKKNKRREKIAAHHGKMAKHIVVLAEQADVDQDNGFISALMLCAGTAGDVATAKAIYLASEVRRLENYRTIGGLDHLGLLRGEMPSKESKVDAIESGSLEMQPSISMKRSKGGALTLQEDDQSMSPQLVYNPRKKKRDTRKLNALLNANANAVEQRGLGDVWCGRENKGYLDESSLRMIQMRYIPKYVDNSIPGMTSSEAGLAGMVWDDEDVEKMGKRLRRKKFMGLIEDQEDNRIDELDPTLYRLLVDDEDVLFDDEQKERLEDASSEDKESSEQTFKLNLDSTGDAFTVEETKTISGDPSNDDIDAHELQQMIDAQTMVQKMMEKDGMSEEDAQQIINADDSEDAEVMEMLKSSGLSQKDIDKMFDNDDLDEDMSEQEQMLFDKLMSDQEMTAEERESFRQMMSEGGDDDDSEEEEMDEDLITKEREAFRQMMSEVGYDDDSEEDGMDEDMTAEEREAFRQMMSEVGDDDDYVEEEMGASVVSSMKASDSQSGLQVMQTSYAEITLPEDADDLDVVLYGLPKSRVDKVRDEFKMNLGIPSMIRLVPLLRENMPDIIDKEWLVEKNLRDANVVMNIAKDERVIDSNLMNSMLQVYAKSSRFDEALEFYEHEFKAMNQVSPK